MWLKGIHETIKFVFFILMTLLSNFWMLLCIKMPINGWQQGYIRRQQIEIICYILNLFIPSIQNKIFLMVSCYVVIHQYIKIFLQKVRFQRNRSDGAIQVVINKARKLILMVDRGSLFRNKNKYTVIRITCGLQFDKLSGDIRGIIQKYCFLVSSIMGCHNSYLN